MGTASTPNDNKPNVRLHTPLPDGVLLLRSFKGAEHLNQPFKITLELYSPNKKKKQVVFEKLLGQPFTIESDVYDREKEKRTGQPRHLSGICVEFHEGQQDALHTSYTAVLAPKIHLLGLQSGSKIHQQKSVPDILKQVLPSSGVEYQLSGTYTPREYCVQYRETDLDFAHRLMEEEGIFYFFKHDACGHTMVVADSATSHPTVQEPSTVDLDSSEGGSRRGAHVSTWKKSQVLKPVKHTLRDYNFQLPNSTLEASKSTQDSSQVGAVSHNLQVTGGMGLEVYDYPGGYGKRVDGINKSGGDQSQQLQTLNTQNQRTAQFRQQAETAKAMEINTATNCAHFVAGHKFTLKESDASQGFGGGGDYILTSVNHDASVDVDHRTGDAGQYNYGNTASFIPSDVEYKGQQKTPKPKVHGMQSGIVVGPAGEEIFTDKYGRVKVQFHWDKDGQKDANSSCWMRVASSSSGAQWGAVHIPRVGQEVMVGFMEGDPDAPVIMGSVHNPNTMPPYSLPDNKTQSGIKTRSTPGGTGENYNEIRFEDKMGNEMLTIHAERDCEITIEHDKTENVQHDETINITNNRTETVGMDQTITITNEDSLTVGVGQTIEIGATQDETIGAARATTVGGADSLDVAGAINVTAGAEYGVTAGADISVTSGAAITITAGAAITITASAAITITAPAILLNGRPVLPIPTPI